MAMKIRTDKFKDRVDRWHSMILLCAELWPVPQTA